MKTTHTVLLFLALNLGLTENVYSQTESKSPALQAAADLKTARSLESAGKHPEALVAYEKLLSRKDLSRQTQNKIATAYEGLNWRLIFSPDQADESYSLFYTVKPGDNLHNIAKANKTTVGLIKKVNNLPKDMIRPAMKLKIITAPFAIRVDKSENMLLLFMKDKLIRHYSVATGKDNNTPVGTFKIVNKLVDPTWYHQGKVVPPGNPENILGTRWLGFDKQGYGIHGTTQPDSIGTQASLGCIRMLNSEVEELYEFIPTGTEVTITD